RPRLSSTAHFRHARLVVRLHRKQVLVPPRLIRGDIGPHAAIPSKDPVAAAGEEILHAANRVAEARRMFRARLEKNDRRAIGGQLTLRAAKDLPLSTFVVDLQEIDVLDSML